MAFPLPAIGLNDLVEQFFDQQKEAARAWLRTEMDGLVENMFGQLKSQFTDILGPKVTELQKIAGVKLQKPRPKKRKGSQKEDALARATGAPQHFPIITEIVMPVVTIPDGAEEVEVDKAAYMEQSSASIFMADPAKSATTYQQLVEQSVSKKKRATPSRRASPRKKKNTAVVQSTINTLNRKDDDSDTVECIEIPSDTEANDGTMQDTQVTSNSAATNDGDPIVHNDPIVPGHIEEIPFEEQLNSVPNEIPTEEEQSEQQQEGELQQEGGEQIIEEELISDFFKVLPSMSDEKWMAKRLQTMSVNCPRVSCTFLFSSESELEQHFNVRHNGRQFLCLENNCNQYYPDSSTLCDHLRSDHTELSFWSCAECPSTFSLYSELQVHTRQDHYIGLFKCISTSTCDFVAPTRHEMSLHLESRHKITATSFICPHPGCGKVFATKTTCQAHSITHKEVKPFSCKWPHCGHMTHRKCFMVSHVRRKHFRLPKFAKRQKEMNIQDDRDPMKWIEIRKDLVTSYMS